jgi:hypothetical protein
MRANRRSEARVSGWWIHGLSSTSGVHDVRGGARSPAPCGLDLLRTVALFACHTMKEVAEVRSGATFDLKVSLIRRSKGLNCLFGAACF